MGFNAQYSWELSARKCFSSPWWLTILPRGDRYTEKSHGPIPNLDACSTTSNWVEKHCRELADCVVPCKYEWNQLSTVPENLNLKHAPEKLGQWNSTSFCGKTFFFSPLLEILTGEHDEYLLHICVTCNNYVHVTRNYVHAHAIMYGAHMCTIHNCEKVGRVALCARHQTKVPPLPFFFAFTFFTFCLLMSTGLPMNICRSSSLAKFQGLLKTYLYTRVVCFSSFITTMNYRNVNFLITEFRTSILSSVFYP